MTVSIMTCEDVRERLPDLSRAGLTEWALVEAHRRECAECREAARLAQESARPVQPVPLHRVLRSWATERIEGIRSAFTGAAATWASQVCLSLRASMTAARLGTTRAIDAGRVSTMWVIARRPRVRLRSIREGSLRAATMLLAGTRAVVMHLAGMVAGVGSASRTVMQAAVVTLADRLARARSMLGDMSQRLVGAAIETGRSATAVLGRALANASQAIKSRTAVAKTRVAAGCTRGRLVALDALKGAAAFAAQGVHTATEAIYAALIFARMVLERSTRAVRRTVSGATVTAVAGLGVCFRFLAARSLPTATRAIDTTLIFARMVLERSTWAVRCRVSGATAAAVARLHYCSRFLAARAVPTATRAIDAAQIFARMVRERSTRAVRRSVSSVTGAGVRRSVSGVTGAALARLADCSRFLTALRRSLEVKPPVYTGLACGAVLITAALFAWPGWRTALFLGQPAPEQVTRERLSQPHPRSRNPSPAARRTAQTPARRAIAGKSPVQDAAASSSRTHRVATPRSSVPAGQAAIPAPMRTRGTTNIPESASDLVANPVSRSAAGESAWASPGRGRSAESPDESEAIEAGRRGTEQP